MKKNILLKCIIEYKYYFKFILIIIIIYKFILSYYNLEQDFKTKNFAIIRRINCGKCGLFSYYITYLGCINNFLNKGFIPIVDLSSFKNVFNDFNNKLINKNPWEMYFYQPFNYSLKNVKQKGKNVKYFVCESKYKDFPYYSIFVNYTLMNFWHSLAKKYIPIKREIIKESNIIMKKLFYDSRNILGILVRGTDYVAIKPKGHPIPPSPDMVIKDIRIMDIKNNYDWLFISTEDDKIRKIFIKNFGKKIKYFAYDKNIQYNYNRHDYLSNNKIIKGNKKYFKIYLINIVILANCIDIICARTSGSVGVYILKNGFRNHKVYNLGYY